MTQARRKRVEVRFSSLACAPRNSVTLSFTEPVGQRIEQVRLCPSLSSPVLAPPRSTSSYPATFSPEPSLAPLPLLLTSALPPTNPRPPALTLDVVEFPGRKVEPLFLRTIREQNRVRIRCKIYCNSAVILQ